MLVGGELEGEKKYCRGVDGGNGCIYLVPFMATQVLELNLSTGESRFIGEKFEPKDGVWNSEDFYDSAVLGKDGMVYALPCNAPKVMMIDPSSATTKFVGDDVQTEFGWRDAVVAENGMVYGVPGNAQQVLKFDPTTQKTTLIGPIFEGIDKWGGGVIGKDGCLYCVPSTGQSRILKFDLEEETGVLIGDELGSEEEEGKYRGAVADENGDIYGIPMGKERDRVFKYDVEKETMSWVGPPIEMLSVSDGKFGADKNLYLVPFNSSKVLQLNVSTGKTELFGEEHKNEYKYSGMVKGSDGNLYGVPYMANQILKVQI